MSAGRHRQPNETLEQWAARSLFEPGEYARFEPNPFLPGPPLTPEGTKEIRERRARGQSEIERRLNIWYRLAMTWPESRPVGGLYDAVIREAQRGAR